MTATAEQVQEFQQTGFIVLPGFLCATQVAEMLEQVQRFVTDVIPTLAPEEAFYEDKSDLATLKQIHRMCEHDSFFAKQMSGELFRPLAESLL